MTLLALAWPQPLAPLHSLGVSALAAILPLAVVLALMGGLRKGGLLSSACGLATAFALALLIWRMPALLAIWSILYGALYAIWSILWIVFAALWLYNITVETGMFDALRAWMTRHASGDACVQVILVAFCFGALLEGTAGFGTPVAITAFMLVGMGFTARRAIVLALIADTTPVAFGALGIPIVALAGVTGLDLMKLSSMEGRQLPFLSAILPAYMVWVVARGKGLKRAWPAAAVAGLSFAFVQFFVSNFWGPWAADIIAALASIALLVIFLRVWKPGRMGEIAASGEPCVSTDYASLGAAAASRDGASPGSAAFLAWSPWIVLSIVMVLWSYWKISVRGQIVLTIPHLHNAVLITLYHRVYAAQYAFQPLATGTAVFLSVLLSAAILRARPRLVARTGAVTLRQLRVPGMTVILIVALAYLFNYSGMAFTLGAAVSHAGEFFPFLSGYLGWVACFLSGSDTASNLLFGNLQVAAAHQLHLNPILTAITNSSGAVTGKMISPQNIAVGVTTVGLVGQEGKVLRSTFWHSMLFAFLISLLALAQAHWLAWMVP